ncbi:DNA phosphorothioation-associated putative methyltransferase [Polyangium aurulentum]|uniref:DNA phosphorothioation-associated putative methyltransferase n=1 Tax=Polyangium aurulentum TaxID=2567896 RepID=UPI0010AEC2F7|nr:DNA phosphorothioation-associated putative methyltransferase [Polyangium aurulentum]UQA61411.1 DNA phosphorothioation-associated putative methyltransferase [Polyangium aurulentum]
MDLSVLAKQVARLSLGKRLPEGVYVHVEALPRLSAELRAAVDAAAAIAEVDAAAFHVVKFAKRGAKISLLAYPTFFQEAFPCLTESWVVDLASHSVTHRTYAPDGNPPILHRKEVLLPPDHPRVPEFAALTTRATEFGLFEDTKAIGTKNAWTAKLERLGLRLDGHQLVETRREASAASHGDCSEPVVQRHRTALQRYSLSTPAQALWRYGFLDTGSSLFDYGCGRGDDVRILKSLGINATGWDPHFAPKEPKQDADVVNIGFVINVIENAQERREALAGAYALARKVLAVAALIGGRTAYERHRLFRDGVLTSRGTFQKYFSQQELREYIETTLGREPIAVEPGLFLVFRDDVEEQRFLAAKQTRARCTVRLTKPAKPEATKHAPRPTRWEQHRALLEAFWDRCLQLGRLPKDSEFPRLAELRGAVGTPQMVLRKLREERGEASLEAARTARMEDLLVYLALNLFERRRSFRHLPENLQHDIGCFWGSYAAAQAEGTKTLFSLGTPEVIHKACATAAAEGVGYLDRDHSLQLHSSLVARLPAVLRIYIGCAARLYGEVDTADLVKIHVHSGKLSLMAYDDFSGRPLPRLLERVKINLRTQNVQFFDYDNSAPVQYLYRKSRYIPPDFERYEEQVAFDKAVESLGLDMADHGPQASVFEETLRERRLKIQDFALVPMHGGAGTGGQ